MRDPNPEPAMKPSRLVFIRISLPLHRGHTGGVSSPLNVRCANVWLHALHRHSAVGMAIESFHGLQADDRRVTRHVDQLGGRGHSGTVDEFLLVYMPGFGAGRAN